MALLSGEVESSPGPLRQGLRPATFRMALLSGEVETRGQGRGNRNRHPRSGWLCYPGKLKRVRVGGLCELLPQSSGWLCYPGKLKLNHVGTYHPAKQEGSGWLCYPGKLKPVAGPEPPAAERCSEWLCYPGKLNLGGQSVPHPFPRSCALPTPPLVWDRRLVCQSSAWARRGRFR